MTSIRFDHFMTYTSAPDIDGYLKEYAAQGFLPREKTVRHNPGLRNGFVFIGPEYLEFCWVEDEALFAEAEAEKKLLRATPRPCAIGMIAGDVQAVHDDWMARGYSIPQVSSTAPRDAPADAPPAWSFQEIPSELLPGAWSFALTYHMRPKDEATQIRIGPNTIYAISGVTFVSSEPEARATNWRDLLAPEEAVDESGNGFQVWIGPHRAMWVAPEEYQAAYGLDWTPFPYPVGELAILHLLASDLRVVKTMTEEAGRRTCPVLVGGEEELLIAPDARDGLVFAVRQRPIEMWLRERTGRTGERLELAQD